LHELHSSFFKFIHFCLSVGKNSSSFGFLVLALRVSKKPNVLECAVGSLFSMAHNGWRYEKLPIAGDSLSSYTKVEAGYNP